MHLLSTEILAGQMLTYIGEITAGARLPVQTLRMSPRCVVCSRNSGS